MVKKKKILDVARASEIVRKNSRIHIREVQQNIFSQALS
jgi:hypothetical protein